MAIFSGVFQIGSMSEVAQEDAEKFLEEFEAIIEDLDAMGIFLHNVAIALPMFIPGFGMIWGLFSSWSTGFAFAALTQVMPELGQIPPLAILFMSPFGIMELVAYSLGISRSFILTRLIIKKLPLKPEMKITGIEIGIMIGLLLAGGFLEFYLIEQFTEGGLEIPEL